MKNISVLSRRHFVLGTSSALALTALPFATQAATNPQKKFNDPATLSGNHFDLQIGYQAVNFTGAKRIATTVNGSLPAPTLRWKEGERVTLRVTNNLHEETSIHWHGIILPSSMDGSPGFDFAGIKPGETFEYQFDVQQNGTYWYHSHSGFQEQTGLFGAIIIDPKDSDPVAYDREMTVLLSDWSDEAPQAVYAKLKKRSDYYNFHERTLSDTWQDIKTKGFSNAFSERKMWNQMRMSERDIADVTGYTYTYLMNGITPDQGWIGLFKPNEKIRLRIINGAGMSIFDLRIPGLKMTVVAADGQNIQPVIVDEFRIAPAETYDVIVEPKAEKAYTLFAQTIDRSGFARGTLTTNPLTINPKVRAEIPAMDPSPVLSMKDMPMADMDMSHMSMSEMENMDMSPPSGLTDPGIGLREHLQLYGRKVLTYSDLRSLHPTRDKREPSRDIELHLTGNMHRYMWSMNGTRFMNAAPLELKYNERVRIILINDTMMTHPFHLHGMWSELETGDPDFIPRKHTVIVQPGAKISYLVTANAKGNWAYHCHLLYHMLGMMRTVRVTGE